MIDADALMENYGLKDATKYGNKDAEQQEHSYSTLMLYEIADIIEDAPTVEAKPVVHCRECCFLEVCKTSQWLGIDGYCSRGEKHD